MAILDVSEKTCKLSGGREARVVGLRGQVDGTTMEDFDSALTRLLGAAENAVLELGGLTYINSRGMSLLIKHHQRLASGGGTLVLAALPEKILATFDIMGLCSTFAFEKDEAAAVARLDGSVEEESEAFPMSISCETCGVELSFEGAGKYRCPRCQSCFEVSGEGEVAALSTNPARWIEVSFPCSPPFVESTRAAAAALAKACSLSQEDAEALDRAVDEAAGLYASKAGEAGGGRARVLLAADERELRAAFLTTDEDLFLTKEDEEGLTLRTIRGVVDEVEIVPLDPQGQMLKLVKRLGG